VAADHPGLRQAGDLVRRIDDTAGCRLRRDTGLVIELIDTLAGVLELIADRGESLDEPAAYVAEQVRRLAAVILAVLLAILGRHGRHRQDEPASAKADAQKR
jgi:hypothetical protein